MVSEGLRALLERGDGVGELTGKDVSTGFAEHPICGDRVELSVRVQGGMLREVRWRAAGCPASMAVAALTTAVLQDVSVQQFESVLHAAIADRGGLKRHERHAAAMVIRALQEAVGV
jgi:NifU-like protein involved in Fe-S cluster formation